MWKLQQILPRLGQSDLLEDSINYVEVYEIVESVMTGEKRNLLSAWGAYCGFLVSTLPRYRRFICNGAGSHLYQLQEF